MVGKGATGMWDRWDQDTQGPGMNGQGFLMLAGDLNAWFYQHLAGIQPDAERPGFRHVLLRPEPVGDLAFVKASYRSMHGRIVSDWKVEEGRFSWRVVVPPNVTATVYVPAPGGAETVTESEKPAGDADGIRFLRFEDGRAVCEVGSGTYSFLSDFPRVAAAKRAPGEVALLHRIAMKPFGPCRDLR